MLMEIGGPLGLLLSEVMLNPHRMRIGYLKLELLSEVVPLYELTIAKN